MRRAYYSSSIAGFINQNPEHILGKITRENTFELNIQQRNAWIEQTQLLKDVLCKYEGKLYFEFSIPRMGRRIDAVVIIDSVIFIIDDNLEANRFVQNRNSKNYSYSF